MKTLKQQQEELEKKSRIATVKHLGNIRRLREEKLSEEKIKEMYSYLDSCWICGKVFTFWDNISFNIVHSFEGNSHRRSCR